MKRKIIIIKDENSYRQFRTVFIIEAITLLSIAAMFGSAITALFFTN